MCVEVLRLPPLSQTLREHGNLEIKKLTWEGAAKACESTYELAMAGQAELMIG